MHRIDRDGGHFAGSIVRHNLLADPVLFDLAKENFGLNPNSPALQLGFQPIDTSKVGLAGYRAD